MVIYPTSEKYSSVYEYARNNTYNTNGAFSFVLRRRLNTPFKLTIQYVDDFSKYDVLGWSETGELPVIKHPVCASKFNSVGKYSSLTEYVAVTRSTLVLLAGIDNALSEVELYDIDRVELLGWDNTGLIPIVLYLDCNQ